MPDFQENRISSAAKRRPDGPGGEEVLLERAVGELRPLPVEEASLLRPQQHRNAVWRWHVRRRQSRS
jgi:hypothetical protein